ncbi:hypothetical protein K469DRAFT_746372 [Zopfia rhizophila CBS 207.26]|uniref:Uncharacterized protein n=1 Tax=Zopfia rhizophila CBS 207.26 TaxID=1314779 RepID=A0A6A6ELL6_9PEZI|nr:hypothetical protein K469DRAFT_746372 [Zopfia rhizophila CBS 207.26]
MTMGSTQTTIEDNTLYQDMGTSPAANSEGSEVANMVENIQSAPKGDDDLGCDGVDGEATSMKHLPPEITKSSPDSPLGVIERTSAVVNLPYHIFERIDKRISNLEGAISYIMRHQDDIDDRIVSLGGNKEIIDTTEKVPDEVHIFKGKNHAFKRGRDATDDKEKRDRKVRKKATSSKGKRHVKLEDGVAETK